MRDELLDDTSALSDGAKVQNQSDTDAAAEQPGVADMTPLFQALLFLFFFVYGEH